jgi:formate hydrogenlyase subunit 6/NADH:ubiquinone oxidoreductase subunit I
VSRKPKKQIDINVELCFGCGDCAVACPLNHLKKKGEDEEKITLKIRNGKVVLYRETCTGCGFCADYCPVEAITVIPIEAE